MSNLIEKRFLELLENYTLHIVPFNNFNNDFYFYCGLRFLNEKNEVIILRDILFPHYISLSKKHIMDVIKQEFNCNYDTQLNLLPPIIYKHLKISAMVCYPHSEI